MIIHIVRPGDTLWSISNQYSAPINRLIEINGLASIPYLIIGQALIIPTSDYVYLVRLGDTLWSISRRFNVSLESLIRINSILNPNLIYVGMPLIIPQEQERPAASIEVNGYIVPRNPQIDSSVTLSVAEYLTYITPSSYQVNADGTLQPLNDSAILEAAKNNNVAPLISITNLTATDFSPTLAHEILINQETQRILFSNVLNIMLSKGYWGLNINFERMFPEDRQLYNQFVARAVDYFHEYNISVSTALVPKTYDMTTGEWWGAHDYKTIGELVDFVVIMTYDWGCVACPPMAIAPVNEIRRVLDYAVSVIPREKILMGVPFYGFDWRLPFITGQRATQVDYTSALQLAAQYGVSIQFDDLSQAPYFSYMDMRGIPHVVWFEDARSFQAKYNLVLEYGLRGVSYWALGMNAPQNWYVLTQMFDIVKIEQ